MGTEKVSETQSNDDDAEGDNDFPANDDESDYGSDFSHTSKKRKTTRKQKPVGKDGAKEKVAATTNELKKVGAVKTAARKIKATAHANYRKLKIKSKGGNGGRQFGGNGGGRRFGRR